MKEGAAAVKGSILAFHEGEILMRVAGTYGTLHDVIMEQTQNAIDAEATKIWIFVNQATRLIIVKDNGEGVTKEMFENALSKVGKTIKKDDKLGRFGLGLVSPLGKCEKMQFISIRKNKSSDFLQWTFIPADIKEQEKLAEIPWDVRSDLIFSEKKSKSKNKDKNFVKWRTCVRIEGYTQDRVIGKLSLEAIESGIMDLYGPTIRRKKIVVEVKIVDESGNKKEKIFTATEFSGKELPRQVIKEDDVGEVIFKLFIANMSGQKRKGSVVLGERDDEFRFPLSNLFRASANCIPAEAASVLRSGVFEGEILAEKCQLQPSRKNFEANDAFLGLCVAIETWYKRFGKKIFEEVQEMRAETRYQELGSRSLKVVAELVSNDSKFDELIKSFKVGSIGIGHAKPDARINGPQEKTSKAISGSGRKTPSADPGRERQEPQKEKPEHRPFTVVGPQGTRRTRVYNNSLGIQLAHEPLKASMAIWKFDVKEGLLIINTKHPHWDECDVNDSTLMRYQEFVIIQALNLELMPEDWKDQNRAYAEELTQSFVFMLLNADALSGRRRGKLKACSKKAA